MSLKSNGIIIAVAKETSFNTAPTFTDSDVIVVDKSDIAPKIDTVDRNRLTGSIIKEAGTPVRFTSSGSIELEVDIKTGAKRTEGSVLFEAGFGQVLEDGGEIQADKVVIGGAADATVYRITAGDIDRISLGIKKWYDSEDVVLQSLGNVIGKVGLEFKQADILKANFDLQGASYQTLTGQTKPTVLPNTEIPFVGKNATFNYGTHSVCAKDIKIDIENDITSIECITSDGYGNQEVVSKKVSGSFTCLLENFDYLNDLTTQTIGSLFLSIPNGTKKVAVYAPAIKLTDVKITDDSNSMIEVSVDFVAEQHTDGETLLLAVKA